jgi:hypothetical protein
MDQAKGEFNRDQQVKDSDRTNLFQHLSRNKVASLLYICAKAQDIGLRHYALEFGE